MLDKETSEELELDPKAVMLSGSRARCAEARRIPGVTGGLGAVQNCNSQAPTACNNFRGEGLGLRGLASGGSRSLREDINIHS